MISTDVPNKTFTSDMNTFLFYFALEKLKKKKKRFPTPQFPLKKKRGFIYCTNEKKICLWVDLLRVLWLNYLLVRNKDVTPETKS